MSRKEEEFQEGAALWAAAREAWRRAEADGRPAPTDEPDAMTLAAYLDGRLGPGEAARVEAWMAASEAGLDLVLGARNVTPEAVPARLTGRAQGLVGAADRAPRRAGGPLARLFARLGDAFAGALRPAGWAATAAAVLLLAAGAFELGRFGTQEIAAVQSLLGEEIAATLPQTGDDFLL